MAGSVVLPVDYLFIGGGVMVAIIAILLMIVIDTRSNAPEAAIFKRARKKGLPVLDITDIGTGESRFLLGKKDGVDEIAFSTGHYGIQVDPSLCSGNTDPSRYRNGLAIYHYCSTKWLPISPHNVLAIQTVKNLRVKYPDLDFLTDLELMTLLNTPRSDLKHDSERFLEKYSPVAIERGTPITLTPNTLISRVREFQDEITKTPVDTGFLAYHHAFSSIPFAHAAQDLEQLKLLIQRKTYAQFQDQIKMWNYVIMALALLGGIGVVIYVISMGGK